MITPRSPAYEEKVRESSRRFRAKLYDGNDEINSYIRKICVYKGSSGASELTIGAVYSSYIEVTLDGKDPGLEGKELRLDIGLLIDEANEIYEDLTMGYFTVLRPKTTAYQTSFTAQGCIAAKLSESFIPPEIQTINNVLSAIMTQCGVTVLLDTGIDGTGIIEKTLRNMTCRQALQVIAGVIGGFATETYDGEIRVSRYSDTVTFTVGSNLMTALPEVSDYDYAISGVTVEAAPETEDDEGEITPAVIYTSPDPNLLIQNEYMTDALFQDYSTALIGLQYRPGTVNLALGDPRIEPWDVAEVTDLRGKIYIIPCMEIVHVFDGGLQTLISAAAPQETTQVQGQLSAAIAGLKLDMLTVQRLFAHYARIGHVDADRLEIKDANGNTIFLADKSGRIFRWDMEHSSLSANGKLTLRDQSESHDGAFQIINPEDDADHYKISTMGSNWFSMEENYEEDWDWLYLSASRIGIRTKNVTGETQVFDVGYSGGENSGAVFNGKTLEEWIESTVGFRVKHYSYIYNISAGGIVNISGTQLDISTPSGFTPVAVLAARSGYGNVTVRTFNGAAIESGIALSLKNIAQEPYSNLEASIDVLYLSTNLTGGGGGGSSGTYDYNALYNKPQIEEVTLQGNKYIEDLGVNRLTNSDIEEMLTLADMS